MSCDLIIGTYTLLTPDVVDLTGMVSHSLAAM